MDLVHNGGPTVSPTRAKRTLERAAKRVLGKDTAMLRKFMCVLHGAEEALASPSGGSSQSPSPRRTTSAGDRENLYVEFAADRSTKGMKNKSLILPGKTHHRTNSLGPESRSRVTVEGVHRTPEQPKLSARSVTSVKDINECSFLKPTIASTM